MGPKGTCSCRQMPPQMQHMQHAQSGFVSGDWPWTIPPLVPDRFHMRHPIRISSKSKKRATTFSAPYKEMRRAQ